MASPQPGFYQSGEPESTSAGSNRADEFGSGNAQLQCRFLLSRGHPIHLEAVGPRGKRDLNSVKQNNDLATNELILSDAPNEAILVKAYIACSWMLLNSIFSIMTKPDSYEHLLLDFIDADNHLFMRSDELVTLNVLFS
uniref:Uncharacterized protein n=1 Tax=Salix viminalis TaxID=40686 RepID=A0A6N2LLC5_SALVM